MEGSLVLKILKTDTFTKRFKPRIYTLDTLPYHLIKNQIYIVHTSNSKTLPSKSGLIRGHFFVIDSLTSDGSCGYQLTLFDSYGRSLESLPYSRIRQIVKYNVKREKGFFAWNDVKLQTGQSTICAHLSIYYCLFKARGYNLETILKEKFSRYSSQNLFAVPAIVESYLPKQIRLARKEKIRLNLDLFS